MTPMSEKHALSCGDAPQAARPQAVGALGRVPVNPAICGNYARPLAGLDWLTLLRQRIFVGVIPGRACSTRARNPYPKHRYGFRARRFAAPRNDF